jgi:TetR/AcrR family transcriptional regulator, mexJK operon transcriptional repressor
MNSSDHDSVMSAPARRGRGRPRDLDKRQAILDAAGSLFLERGIAATTMEAVAAAASVSKMTVYGHFADKPALLTAVFERNTKGIRLPELSGSADLPSSLDHLIEFGEGLVAFLTRPEIVRSAAVMAASADQFPALAAAFYAAGPGATLAKVAAFLNSLVGHKLLTIADPELAAEQLVAAWLGLTQMRQSLGVAAPPSRDAIAGRVRLATETMVHAWSRR